MSYIQAAAPKPGGKREERSVMAVFRHSSWQHCAGINSAVVSADGDRLWTASRDSVIKRWDISSASPSSFLSSPSLQANYEGHIDWVNAITLLGQDTLISCSSDKTIRVWKANEEPHLSAPSTDSALTALSSSACLCGHSDYVTSLAAASTRPLVASGGLGGELFLWDLQSSPTIATSKIDGIHGSIYSLIGDASNTMLAAGTSDGCIWMVDTRSGRAEWQLRGHSANVRALCMRSDASALISGSADHTMRAWDLRQRRAYSTLAVHTDSVWTLYPADNDMESVFSGGRDGCVYKTHIASKMSKLVALENSPVTTLAPVLGTKGGDILWIGTTNSTIRCWKVSEDPAVASLANPPLPTTANHRHSHHSSQFVAGNLPAVRSRMLFDGGVSHPPLPRSSSVITAIDGVPPVRQVAVLTNRRHVLTLDAEENVLLWDLSIGHPVRNLGKVGLQDAERELFDPAHNVWPWFQSDTRLGCLAIVMEYPGCFLAEAYRRDLGETTAPPDAKINMAQYMINALFAQWAEKNGANLEECGSSSPSAGGLSPSHTRFIFHCDIPPVVMVSSGNGVPPWRCAVNAFNGSEAEGDIVPQWVGDCVLRGKIPVGKDLKMAFILVPSPKSGLPSLLQSKLNAPRVLGVDKVADYVMRKMAEQGHNLAEEPLFWSPEKQALWEEEQRKGVSDGDKDGVQGGSPTKTESDSGRSGSGALGLMGIRQLRPIAASPQPPTPQPLLITCGGAVVPWDFTLAAVRQWMWKRSEDLKLEYGIRELGTELKPPIIRPPS